MVHADQKGSEKKACRRKTLCQKHQFTSVDPKIVKRFAEARGVRVDGVRKFWNTNALSEKKRRGILLYGVCGVHM